MRASQLIKISGSRSHNRFGPIRNGFQKQYRKPVFAPHKDDALPRVGLINRVRDVPRKYNAIEAQGLKKPPAVRTQFYRVYNNVRFKNVHRSTAATGSFYYFFFFIFLSTIRFLQTEKGMIMISFFFPPCNLC